MTTAIERIERIESSDTTLALEERFAVAVRQRELLEDYIKARLKPAKHFYTVAGSDKPSLNKDGAEVICLPHGYKAKYDKLAGPDQPPTDDSPYQITVKARLFSSRGEAGEGLGSASSHITRRDGQRVPRQTDPGLRHNATLKMAQKSAYISATLSSTAASEFFTQDLEDAVDTVINKTGHWCEAHQTNWFKRGKMRRFAHPIGETGEWCNEPAATPVSASVHDSAPIDNDRGTAATQEEVQAIVEAEGMQWSHFELQVLRKSWAEFIKTRGASPAVALAMWVNWKKDHPRPSTEAATGPADPKAVVGATRVPE